MEILFVLIFIPTIVFLVVVAPLWIILHYNSKKKMTRQLSDEDQDELQSLADQARDMGKRIETLEAILDAETPHWRKRSDELK
ncbi:MAG: envelope stress response membrane protein PspB [Gammaproteobacteria bacterium]|nr:envelope stress response membrane protein PspB [Gammaproteobacteria bacterium]